MAGFEEFIGELREKLGKPLPGLASQLKMAGTRRLVKDGKVIIPGDARKSAVLVLFYPSEEKINLVFIKRTEYPGVHSGQISFPGGGWENGDKNLEETALREAEEEIGVDRKNIVTIGYLTDLFIPPSNFLVTPVVGYCMERPDFKPDPAEVDRILEIPLDHFFLQETKQVREISVYPDLRFEAPGFHIDGNIIWGATAMMLHELLDVISPGA
jgi:8-oxo-dGTP pyrophosphatase MutT (NUDIX family)